MNIAPIKNQRDYRRALKEIEGLMVARRNAGLGIPAESLISAGKAKAA